VGRLRCALRTETEADLACGWQWLAVGGSGWQLAAVGGSGCRVSGHATASVATANPVTRSALMPRLGPVEARTAASDVPGGCGRRAHDLLADRLVGRQAGPDQGVAACPTPSAPCAAGGPPPMAIDAPSTAATPRQSARSPSISGLSVLASTAPTVAHQGTQRGGLGPPPDRRGVGAWGQAALGSSCMMPITLPSVSAR
jgi:hypothetical protein